MSPNSSGWMDGWMERRGASTTVLTRRWSEQRTEGEGGRWGLRCVEDSVLAWADVGVHGQTYKRDAHELTQLLSRFCGSMSAELCSTPSTSPEFLPPSLGSLSTVFCFVGTLVFPPASKLLFHKEQKEALCFCFFALRC